MTRQLREVTPEDSFVPVYEEIWTEEELAQREANGLAEQAARQTEQESKAAQKAAILERIGLTEEELQIVLNN
jgi:hypothetical protein